MQHNATIQDGAGQIGEFYVNPHRVIFCWLSEDLISVTAHYPGPTGDDDIDLEYSHIAVTDDFEKTFGVNSADEHKVLQQINSITGQYLEKLYNKGLAQTACTLHTDEGSHTLYFWKHAGIMIVSDDAGNKQKQLPAVLEAPGEFISYTKSYFRRVGPGY